VKTLPIRLNLLNNFVMGFRISGRPAETGLIPVEPGPRIFMSLWLPFDHQRP
jgi:hypothetical protein